MKDAERQKMTSALLKLLVVSVVMAGAVIALALFMIEKLSPPETTPAQQAEARRSSSPLPTVALDASETPSPSTEESESVTPSPTPEPTAIRLQASPESVGAGQRINLTGKYDEDGTLQVQRREGGSWVDFADVTASANGGSFSTWVITSRTGVNRFRMLDPGNDEASNPVRVTVR